MADREKGVGSAAKALSALGAKKGGDARARALTAEQRSESARIAAAARWGVQGKDSAIAFAKYGAPDRPLRIGDIEIPCYVLADGRRVLSQRGLQGGVGLSRSAGKGGARRMAALMEFLESKGVDTKGLAARANNPIRFRTTRGVLADGYEATILPDICAVIIEADREGRLLPSQKHIADRCAVLQHGFATVGIIALVDEATGYQDERAKDALALILEKFVAKELQPWVRTFPKDYYEQIYRLNGWHYSDDRSARPGVVGHMTNNIVYKRLAPAVLDELRRLTPRDQRGRLKHKLFQHLTDDIGHPKLREHLTGVVMLMKYSPTWEIFMDRLDTEYPQWGATLMLPFPKDYNPPAIEPSSEPLNARPSLQLSSGESQ